MSNIVLGLDFKVIAHSVGVGVSLLHQTARPSDGVHVYLVKFDYLSPHTFYVTKGVFSPGLSHVMEDARSTCDPLSIHQALRWVPGEPPTCDVPIPPDVLQETLQILQGMGHVQKQRDQEQERQRRWMNGVDLR